MNIIYILQKGYETKTAKGVDELNALALNGYTFIKAVVKEKPVVKDQEPDQEYPFVCNLCGKGYKSEKPYLKHIETCEG